MKFTEAGNSIIEAGSSPNESHILILEEGPGNPKNKCYYGPEAVKDAVTAFRGVRMFANHLGREEAKNRPERDVEAVVGRVKETYLRTDEDSGKLQCWGVAKVVEGDSCKWIKERINESVRAVQEGFTPIMQTSINGDGDAEPRDMNGDRWNYVRAIKRGISVDFVPMGGVKNAGFRDIMESANLSGGNMNMEFLQTLSAQDRQRYERINGVIEAALDAEDIDFIDGIHAQLSEAEDDADDVEMLDEDYADEDYADVDGDEAQPAYLLTLEDGSQIEAGEPHEIDADGNAVWYTEDGEQIVMAADDGDYDYEDDFEDVDDAQYADDMGEDEVDFEDLKARYPVLAAELERDEVAQRTHEANMDIGNLVESLQETRLRTRAEKVLLESRIVAETKLAEAGVPNELLSPDKLVGLTPVAMDREIQRAIDHVEFTQAMIQEALSMNGGDAGFNRSTPAQDVGVGRRILAGACRKL